MQNVDFKSIVEKVSKWFEDYTQKAIKSFPDAEHGLVLKKEHSLRVLEETNLLAAKLGLLGDKLYIAQINAILHDVGRFEQFRKYKNFADFRSFDHAALSVRTIHKSRLFADYGLYACLFKSWALRPIAFHNRLILPENESDDVIYFTRLLRDADKIDILRITTSLLKDDKIKGAVLLDLPENDGISDDVFETVMAGKPVRYSSMKNLNDFRAVQLGWVFDICFRESLRRIVDLGFVKTLFEVLPKDQKHSLLENRISTYIKERLA